MKCIFKNLNNSVKGMIVSVLGPIFLYHQVLSIVVTNLPMIIGTRSNIYFIAKRSLDLGHA